MEVETVVVSHLDEFNEIGDGFGGAAVKEFDGYVACGGLHENVHGSTTNRHFKRICLSCSKPHLDN